MTTSSTSYASSCKQSSKPSDTFQSREKVVDIFNHDLEINLDNEITYKSIPCSVDTNDVPNEKLIPPPLTKRINIELEHLFHDKNFMDNNSL